jgi:hypothetical protein
MEQESSPEVFDAVLPIDSNSSRISGRRRRVTAYDFTQEVISLKLPDSAEMLRFTKSHNTFVYASTTCELDRSTHPSG